MLSPEEFSQLYPAPLLHWSKAPGASQTPAYFAEAADGQTLFVKYDPECSGILEAEAQGLAALAKTGVVRVPHVYQSRPEWLVMEAIEREPATDLFWRRLAESLAALHQHTGPIGWNRDNFLGRIPQLNHWSSDQGSWADFFWQKRLTPQLQKLRERHPLSTLDEARMAKLKDHVLSLLDHEEQPAQLLHGDLWSGNILCARDQQPVLIDPAVYFGQGEADLAMTELFGGFAQAFYQRYREIYPESSGYAQRRDIYNLYHKINHANLYGSGYLWDARSTLLRLSS